MLAVSSYEIKDNILDRESNNTMNFKLSNFTPRLYQQTVLNTCVNKNSLVVLPTGMGKTSIAMMLACQRLNCYPNSKILFLAPTKPLVQQHLNTFKAHFKEDKNNEDEFVLFTGTVAPKKRAELWDNARFIFSTPQGLENDIITKRINLQDVCLLVVDEAQHAVGDYAYVFVAKQYQKFAQFPRILALTASPGSDMEKIKEVCTNLTIDDVEIRTEVDPDVKPYIQKLNIKWVKLEFPKEFKEIRDSLNKSFRSKISSVQRHIKVSNPSFVTKKELLRMQARIRSEINKGTKDYDLFTSISLIAEAMKVQHGIELIETQGVEPVYHYLQKIMDESYSTKTKAVKNLVKDPHFRYALAESKKIFEKGLEHPKLDALKTLITSEIKENPKTKIIVFNQYRDMADKIVKELSYEKIKAKIFIGQAKKNGKGLSQKEQKQILEDFSNNKFNILVSTSVGEEGIDIPKVNSVIFYEPVPSAIRQIQRRGRTARTGEGKLYVLMTKNTRDEAYKWVAQHKERRMYSTLNEIKKSITTVVKKENKEIKSQKNLNNFISKKSLEIEEFEDPKIIADDREKASGVIKELINNNINIELKRLEVGDYILSKQVVVEFKTTEDFVDSIVDGRLLSQLKEMKKNFAKPLVIVEGEQDMYTVRNIHPNALRGMLATITISYGFPILFTKNNAETASLLNIIAKREQQDNNSNFSMHFSKPLSLKEQQEYLVSSLPSVGNNLAKNLLKNFGSVMKVFNAKEDDLKQINLMGDKKIKNMKQILLSDYK